MITTFYYLYYQDEAIGQIVPEVYKDNGFKVFHDESVGIIKVEHLNKEVGQFHWNGVSDVIKVLKKNWENGVVVEEGEVKTLKLPKTDNHNWTEVKQ